MCKHKLEQALNNWQAKCGEYECELSVTSSPEKQFELRKKIKECQEEIKRLKAEPSLFSEVPDIDEIKQTVYKSLYRLRQNDLKFKQKIDELIERIKQMSEVPNFQTPQKNITGEIKDISDLYTNSLSELNELYQTFQKDLDRADEMDLTRTERVQDIVRKNYKPKQP